jgi:hypothetical protein
MTIPVEVKSALEKALDERRELQKQMAIDREKRRLEKEEQVSTCGEFRV